MLAIGVIIRLRHEIEPVADTTAALKHPSQPCVQSCTNFVDAWTVVWQRDADTNVAVSSLVDMGYHGRWFSLHGLQTLGAKL